jgi:hypothetical protein
MSIALSKRAAIAIIVAACSRQIAAQEKKPVPKDSVRVAVPGCTKGYIFTAGPRTTDEPGSFEIPEGMHLRMNAPKPMMAEIKAREGSMIEIVGLMKKGQYKEGVSVGKGVRISPGSGPNGRIPGPGAGQFMIDVEGWRPVAGVCRSR